MRDGHDQVPERGRRVAASFARVDFLRHLGASLREVGEGMVEIEMPFAQALAQQHGYAHGGAIATILDAACGYAALSVMPPGSEVLSVEFKINFLSPAVGERFVARGRVVRAGRTLCVCQGEVVAIGPGVGPAITRGAERAESTSGEKMIAVMQATIARVEAGGNRG